MSVEELKRVVLEKARAEADQIIAEAYKKAEAIVREAEEKRKRFIESEKSKLRRELQVESRIGEARRRARLVLSSARAEIAREIEEKALEKLGNLDPEKRAASLRILLEESLAELRRAVPSLNKVEVYVSPGDKSNIEELLRTMGGNVDFKVIEDPSIIGGVKVSSGEVVVDNTYNTRLRKASVEVFKEVLRELSA
ncbi:MAG: F0F1 ATP synthase subunit delta [Thermogladius sp.]|nr:F0F1 ATP synthase subunit delta [Thermogladius sp.]